MTYAGNMLVSVRDSASRLPYANATDFDGVPGLEYPITYNASGSLVSDAGRGIARIDYDRQNNPVRIQFTNGSVTRYVYSAAGEKLRATHLTAVQNITVAIGSTRELSPSEILGADSTDYLLGGSLTMRNGRIDKYFFDEGYAQATEYSGNASQDNFTFYYYDRDHLGSIRQVVDASGTVRQVTNYYPFGTPYTESSAVMDASLQPYKYNGKELDRMHGLNTYDYGARQYNPVLGRWDRMDPLCEKYYDVSPYGYCGNNPVRYIDPDGRDIYMLFYITGNVKKNDDSMFKACAETRKRDIENSKGFDKKGDIVILKGIQDLGKIGDEVNDIINEYSKEYGKTAEFGLWSHNGLEDGPIGSVLTSSDALDKMQMNIDGWSKIDFNWSENASAGFYGCNSGSKLDDRASFTTTLSGKKNFRNVDIYGQTNYSYPSTSSTSRKTSTEMLRGNFSVPTYMVGCNKGQGLKAFFGGTTISPMRKSRNGRGVIVK